MPIVTVRIWTAKSFSDFIGFSGGSTSNPVSVAAGRWSPE
jgi:hypothetical protein